MAARRATRASARAGELPGPGSQRSGVLPGPAASRDRLSPWLLALLLGLGVLAYHELLTWDPRSHALPALEGQLFLPSETIPFPLVVLMAAGLVYARRRRLREAVATSASWPGALLLLLASGLFLWARFVEATELLVISLFPMVLGASQVLAGGRFARLLAVPLVVLVFAIPIPGVVRNALVHPLQLGTAHLVERLLQALGMPAFVQGLTVFRPEGVFQVIETCSGLRSIEILTLLAVVYVALFPAPRLHAMLLILAAPVLAFLLNGVRVAILIYSGRSEIQSMHVTQGLAAFFVGIALLSLLDYALYRVLRVRAARWEAIQTPELDSPGGTARRRRAWVLASWLAVLGAASFWLPTWQIAPPTQPTWTPAELPGWSAREVEPDFQFLDGTGFSRLSHVAYERAGERVTLLLGWHDRLRTDRSLVSPKTALPGPEWDVEERRRVKLEPADSRVQWLLLRAGPRRALVFHTYRGVESLLDETIRAVLALDRSPWRRAEPARVIRLATEVPVGPGGLHEAEARLRAFFVLLAPQLRDRGVASSRAGSFPTGLLGLRLRR